MEKISLTADHLIVPSTRHSLKALADSVVLLTVVKQPAREVG